MNEDLLRRLRDINPEPSTHENPDEMATVFATIDAKRLVMATEEKTATETVNPQQSWRRGTMAFVGASVLVLLIVGGGVLLLGRSSEPVADGTPTPTATPTTQPSPTTVPTTTPTTQAVSTTVPVVPVLAWQRIDLDGPSEAGNLIAGGPGYIRAGTICTTVDWVVCAEQQPAIWGSADGVEWERVAQEVFVGVNASISDITSGPAGFVAVGIGKPVSRFDTGRLWISPDGTNWSAVPDPDNVFVGSGFTIVESVTAGGPGYVVVGWENPGGSDTNAMVWLSQDGLAWDRVEDPDLLGDPANGDSADMTDVVSGGPGLVAYGSAVWISADGTEWDRIADVEFDIMTINPASGRLLGFTPKSPDRQQEVWISDDGTQWTHVGTLPEAPGDISAIAWDRNILVVVVGDEEPDAAWSVWMSTDAGITWSRADTDALQPHEGNILAIGSAIFDGSRFIISGAECDRTADNCQSVIWIGT